MLRHYLDEGDHARARYRLTRSVPALREREIAGMQRYQETFRVFIRSWDADPDPADVLRVDLHAELLAAALVTAHNHVLRRWLRGTTDDPMAEFDTGDGRGRATLLDPRVEGRSRGRPRSGRGSRPGPHRGPGGPVVTRAIDRRARFDT